MTPTPLLLILQLSHAMRLIKQIPSSVPLDSTHHLLLCIHVRTRFSLYKSILISSSFKNRGDHVQWLRRRGRRCTAEEGAFGGFLSGHNL